MRLSSLGLAIAMAVSSAPARAEDPRSWFNKAVEYDLQNGGEESARLAFAWYRRAAEAGLPEAEFNVAVMLDSGRGTSRDLGQAAVWYARAAAHGNQRAGYNLGQLYDAGQGVPPNADLARTWFAQSDLPAARTHHVRRPVPAKDLSPPFAVAPGDGENLHTSRDTVVFVWTSRQQPESVRYFVELLALDPSGSRPVFSGSTEASSLLAKVPDMHGPYAWRVFAVARHAGRYLASDWQRFTVPPGEDRLSSGNTD